MRKSYGVVLLAMGMTVLVGNDAYSRSALLAKHGMGITPVVVSEDRVGNLPYREDEISVTDAQAELKDGSGLSALILQKTCGSTEAADKLSRRQLTAAFNELLDRPDLHTMVDAGKLGLKEFTAFLLLSLEKERGSHDKNVQGNIRTLNRALLAKAYPRTIVPRQKVYLPAGQAQYGYEALYPEGEAEHTLPQVAYRLLGDDGKAYDLRIDNASPQLPEVDWTWCQGELIYSYCLSSDRKLPRGRFAVFGETKDLDRVSVKWYPAERTDTVKKGIAADDIDLAEAKKELQAGSAAGDPLTALLLEKAGIAKEEIDAVTAPQLLAALDGLTALPDLSRLTNEEIPTGNYRTSEDTQLLNRTLLARAFPRLFVPRQEFTPPADGAPLEREDRNSAAPYANFSLYERRTCEIPGVNARLAYDRYVDWKAPLLDARKYIDTIGSFEAAGNVKNIAGTFVAGDSGTSLGCGLGEILGAIEIAKGDEREIWLVCHVRDLEVEYYGTIQWLPEAPLSKGRASLFPENDHNEYQWSFPAAAR